VEPVDKLKLIKANIYFFWVMYIAMITDLLAWAASVEQEKLADVKMSESEMNSK